VPDQKPPRLAGDDRATLLALLRYQRTSLVRKVSGVDDEAARRSPVGSGTSLLWLTRHMARAEHTWVVRRFAGLESAPPGEGTHPDDTMSAAIAAYREMWIVVDGIVEGAATLDEPCRGDVDHPAVNLRWVLAHLLEETARHAGHADIVREQIDGQTGR
jgi:hypothetical protein